jgi:hypothetical protein
MARVAGAFMIDPSPEGNASREALINAIVDALKPRIAKDARKELEEELLPYCEQVFCLQTSLVPPGAESRDPNFAIPYDAPATAKQNRDALEEFGLALERAARAYTRFQGHLPTRNDAVTLLQDAALARRVAASLKVPRARGDGRPKQICAELALLRGGPDADLGRHCRAALRKPRRLVGH